jgi:hypothetical protein
MVVVIVLAGLAIAIQDNDVRDDELEIVVNLVAHD